MFLALLATAAFAGSSAGSPADSVRYAQIFNTLGSPAATLAKLEEAVAIFGDDGEVVIRLAEAQLAAKKYDSAITNYQKAMTLGADRPKFKAGCEYNLACAYTLKGDKEAGYRWLALSMKDGFRDLGHVRADPDLRPLHADKRWVELAAAKDVSKMNRDEGWRYDLWVLDREVRRIHFNAYRYHDKADQDGWVRKLRDAIPKMTDDQVKVSFLKYMRRLGDGHSGIRFAPAGSKIFTPIQCYWFTEGIFVILTDSTHKDLLGCQVLEVNGRPVLDVVKALDEVISQDNSQDVRSIAPIRMEIPAILSGLNLGGDGKTETLKVRMPEGQERVVTLSGDTAGPDKSWVSCRDVTPEKQPLYLRHRDLPYWFEYLRDRKTVYFQYNSVRNDPSEPTDKFAKRLSEFIDKNDVERLIVDARWNGGGNSFLNMPLVNMIIGCRKVAENGHLFVIAGRQTFSAAQNFVTDIDRQCNAIFVGEPTGSRPNFVGESVSFELPYSKMQGSISDLSWQRSWPMDDRIWIAPQLPAPPTFAMYKDNRDPAMEAIQEYVRQQEK